MSFEVSNVVVDVVEVSGHQTLVKHYYESERASLFDNRFFILLSVR